MATRTTIPPVDETVHARTGAKKTTTPEATPAEINVQQKTDAERSQRLAAPANGGASSILRKVVQEKIQGESTCRRL